MARSRDINDLTIAFLDRVRTVIEADVAVRFREAVSRIFDASDVRSRVVRKDPRGPRRRSSSPALRRMRKLQGQYIGALRGLDERDRARVKAIAKTKGVAEAVRVAHRLKK